MKIENKILIVGLIFATLTGVAVFIDWESFLDLHILGECGYFFSNYVYIAFMLFGIIYTIVLSRKYEECKGVFWQALIVILLLTALHMGIKAVFGEWTPRPSKLHGGFPSGHSQVVFALAFLMSVRNKKLTILTFLVAALIAWSRIYSVRFVEGVEYIPAHYPYQVLFGSYFGVLLTYLMYEYLEPKRELIMERIRKQKRV
ncbi:MAG: phosphatase PAP2 family protein [Abditibacteriota bacterium]|nr:phosphatase PAP2 family protein [Abditibacteriota bacterium]